jgi:hypothetical protein
MANKALAKRQKLTLRIEPSQKAPRNPVAPAARMRAAGPHRKNASAQRQALLRLLRSKVADGDA